MVDPAYLADQKMKMPDLMGASPLYDGFCNKQGEGQGTEAVISLCAFGRGRSGSEQAAESFVQQKPNCTSEINNLRFL